MLGLLVDITFSTNSFQFYRKNVAEPISKYLLWSKLDSAPNTATHDEYIILKSKEVLDEVFARLLQFAFLVRLFRCSSLVTTYLL